MCRIHVIFRAEHCGVNAPEHGVFDMRSVADDRIPVASHAGKPEKDSLMIRARRACREGKVVVVSDRYGKTCICAVAGPEAAEQPLFIGVRARCRNGVVIADRDLLHAVDEPDRVASAVQRHVVVIAHLKIRAGRLLVELDLRGIARRSQGVPITDRDALQRSTKRARSELERAVVDRSDGGRVGSSLE